MGEYQENLVEPLLAHTALNGTVRTVLGTVRRDNCTFARRKYIPIICWFLLVGWPGAQTLPQRCGVTPTVRKDDVVEILFTKKKDIMQALTPCVQGCTRHQFA